MTSRSTKLFSQFRCNIILFLFYFMFFSIFSFPSSFNHSSKLPVSIYFILISLYSLRLSDLQFCFAPVYAFLFHFLFNYILFLIFLSIFFCILFHSKPFIFLFFSIFVYLSYLIHFSTPLVKLDQSSIDRNVYPILLLSVNQLTAKLKIADSI